MKPLHIYPVVVMVSLTGCEAFGPTELPTWNTDIRAAVVYTGIPIAQPEPELYGSGVDTGYRPAVVVEQQLDVLDSDLAVGYPADFASASMPKLVLNEEGIPILPAAWIPPIIDIDEIRAVMWSDHYY